MNQNDPPQLQLGLLRSSDRTLGLKESISKSVKSGDVVLDAGCGTGLLSLLALQAGASKIIAIDSYDLQLAKAIAMENNAADAIEFVQADLRELDLSTTSLGNNKLDVIIAMLYSGHPRFDRDQVILKQSIVNRYLAPDGIVIPNQVRFWAYPCDWADHDFSQYCLESERYVRDIEQQLGIKLQAFNHYLQKITGDDLGVMIRNINVYSGNNILFPHSSPDRLERSMSRILSKPLLVADINYQNRNNGNSFPENITFDITETGRITAIIWVRELLHNDLLISSREVASLVRQPLWLHQGEKCVARLDDIWQATNVVSIDNTSDIF